MAASEKSNTVADSKIAKINCLSQRFSEKETITNCVTMCKYCWKQIYVGGKIFWCSQKNISVYGAIKLSQLERKPQTSNLHKINAPLNADAGSQQGLMLKKKARDYKNGL